MFRRPSYVRAIDMQNKFTIPLQKKTGVIFCSYRNFTKRRRINFLSSSHFTHESSASLFVFHLNTDTPLACIHFFWSNTLLIYLVTPHTLCFRSFPTTLKQLWISFELFLSYRYFLSGWKTEHVRDSSRMELQQRMWGTTTLYTATLH